MFVDHQSIHYSIESYLCYMFYRLDLSIAFVPECIINKTNQAFLKVTLCFTCVFTVVVLHLGHTAESVNNHKIHNFHF